MLISDHYIEISKSFSKIVKKIVFSRIINFLNAHFILTPTQYGFRSNYSTTHAVLLIDIV